jgi:hypothetical protein
LPDLPDFEDGLTGRFELICDLPHVGVAYDRDHSDPAIERPRHFPWCDMSTFLQHPEQRGQVPIANIDLGVTA